ncbi:MAG: hypothetical protein ACQETE_03705 [Bacteroidota bacterium]
MPVQKTNAQHYVSFGVGSNSYVGDLTPKRSMGQLNVSVRYLKQLDDNLAFKATLNIGEIEGEYKPGDPVQLLNTDREPNTFFHTRINSLDIGLRWTYWKTSFVDLYAGVGLGILTFNIQDDNNRNLDDRPETRLVDEEYSLRAAVVPLSVGLVLLKGKKISLQIEQSWNFTNTDYLDNIGYLGTENNNDYVIRRSLSLRYQL